MSTTRLELLRHVAKTGLRYATGLPSSAGTQTTIVDVSADSPFDTADDDDLFANIWFKIEADSAASPLNVGEVSRATTYAPSTGTITVGRAYTNNTTTTMTYGAYFGAPPTRNGMEKGLDEYVNDALRLMYYRDLVLLTLVTDGDMETTGTTNWTQVNCTGTKVTAAANVHTGKQALRVVNSAANGYARSALVSVTDTRSYAVMAACRSASGTAKLQLYDETNAAEIDSVSHDQTEWRYQWMSVSIPSGCEQVSVRLVGVEQTADTYWDVVSLRPNAAGRMDLPTWLVDKGAFEELWCWRAGSGTSSDGYSIDEKLRSVIPYWRVVDNVTGATPYRVEYGSAPGSNELLFASIMRRYTELSADTDSTDADKDWVAAGALAGFMTDKRGIAHPDTRRWLEAFAALSAVYQPKRRDRM